MNRLLLIFFLLGFTLISVGQAKISVSGRISDQKTKKSISGVTVNVIENGVVISSVKSSGGGSYNMLLTFNKNYKIEFSKPGMVTKYFTMDVRDVIEEDLPPGNLTSKVDMTLFKDNPAVDFGFLNSTPVAAFFYDAMVGGLDYNKSKSKKVSKQIEKLLEEAEEQGDKEDDKRKDFEKLMSEGEGLSGSKNYEGALQKYEQADALIPGDPLAKARIKEVKEKIKAQKQEADYNKYITQADNAFSNKSYDDALAKYNQALNIKPNESHPTNRIIEIEELLEAEKKKNADAEALEEKYKNLITAADNLASQKKYEKALTKYTEAWTLKENEAYPKAKITEINAILDKLKNEAEKQANYDQLIKDADSKFSAKSYEEAKAKYTEASSLFPSEAHPKTRITEIDKLLADLAKSKELDEKYNTFITDGDNLFGAKNYAEAKQKYEAALQLKADEGYPKDQLTKIQSELDKIKESEALEAAYNLLIQEAKTKFDAKDYEGAKVKYQEALAKKENEFPKTKIKEIEKILLDLKAEQENQEVYDRLMGEAKTFFDAKEYEKAKAKYENAADRKPSEQLPIDKIAEIKKLIKQQEEDAKLALIEKQYQGFMTAGNDKMIESNFKGAIDEYKSALLVKAGDQDALNKITEANAKIKEAEELAKKEAEEKEYNDLLQKGSELMASSKWSDAKVKYEDALAMRPDAQLPKDKIAEIDKKISEMDADQAKEDQYNSLIAAADDYYNGDKWNEAKTKYEEALTIKADESKPKERIIEIDKKLEELAKNNAELKAYQDKLKLADDSFNAGKYEASIPLYEAASSLQDAEIYPKTQIIKANEKIKELANQKENEAYLAVVEAADQLRVAKKNDEAIAKYKEALNLRSSEVYPQQQIDRIKELIQKQKDALANKEQAEKDYKNYIEKGASALASNELETALDHYQNAENIKPDESLPKDKIAEIKGLIVKRDGAKDVETKYQSYIDQADQMMASNSYAAAITAYKSALSIKANETYPTEQIVLAEKFLNEKEAVTDNKDYDRFMKEGNKYMAQDNMLDAAEDYFKRALTAKPGDQTATDKISEINQMRADIAGAKEKKIKDDNEYKKLISEADAYFEAKDWPKASESYTAARNIYDREWPREQLEAIKKIKTESKIVISDSQYNKTLKVADKAFAEANYDKAIRLYTKAVGYRDEDQYPKDQLKKIEDILFEKDKGNIELSDLGEKVSISLEQMNKNFEESIINSEFIETKNIEKVKDNFGESNDSLSNSQTRGIEKTKLDVDQYQKDNELLTVIMDDDRKLNEVRVDEFNVKIDKQGTALSIDEWMDIDRTRSDVDLAVRNQSDRFVEADENRIEMEKKVVDYNVDMDKTSDERSYNSEMDINTLKLNIENNEIAMVSSFNGMDNNRVETVKTTELYVENLDVVETEKLNNSVDEIHKVSNDLETFKKDVSERDLLADNNRKETVDKVETYENGMVIHNNEKTDQFVDKARDVKEETDLLVYKRDENTQKFDEKRIDNVDDIEKMELKNEKHVKTLDDGAIEKSDDAKLLADKLMELRSGDFNEQIANDLADKFPEGMTEEIFQDKNDKGEILGFIVRRIVVEGDRGDVFIMRKNRFGTSFTKNGDPITQFVWDDESYR